jgi:GT2 family glycosyltransferase
MSRHYFNIDQPKVSILLLKEKKGLLSMGILASIQSNSYPHYEVIVVNIGAEEGEVLGLYKVYPNIKQISLPKDTEKEYALSEGLKFAKGNFLLFLNEIEEINTDFVDLLVSAAKKSKRIAIVSPQVRDYKKKEISLFRASDQPRGVNGYLEINSYHELKPNLNEDLPRFAHFACNDAFLISMEFMHLIEERQQGSFFFLDEIDIAETVHENRYKVYYEPKAVAYLDFLKINNDSRSVYLKTRNRIASIRKHKHGFALLFMLILFSFSAIPKNTFHHLMHLRLDHILAFYRGVIWNVFHSVKHGGFLSHFKWKQNI